MKPLLTKKPKDMTTKQLRAITDACHRESRKRVERQRIDELKDFVDGMFKFRNSYSCPSAESDYWWMYLYVKEVQDGRLLTFEFQTDKNGKITMEDNCVHYNMSGNYIACDEKEFNTELNKVMKKFITVSNYDVDSFKL